MVNVLSLPDDLLGRLAYPEGRHGFPMADSGEIGVSGARNGVDSPGKEGSNRAK